MHKFKGIQWWFVKPDTFVPGRYFRIKEFSGLLNGSLVWTWKSVPALFVRTSEISGLSEPGLTNHHCIPGSYINVRETQHVHEIEDGKLKLSNSRVSQHLYGYKLSIRSLICQSHLEDLSSLSNFLLPKTWLWEITLVTFSEKFCTT